VFIRFKDFKNLVENQTGRKIRCLRTDNGSELCFDEFERYFKDHGIKRHKTTPYTLRKNGVAERFNRTVMERAQSMLSSASLEEKLWAEATTTACYLVNRSPNSTLVDKKPLEAWSSKKPSLRHVRVLGCEAYAYVPDVKRSKFENKVVKCIFIRYSANIKGYKL
jgi:transposase InsO family protein